ncbi:MAG: FtsX-like permease family protein [Sumerlaeia bacterium]
MQSIAANQPRKKTKTFSPIVSRIIGWLSDVLLFVIFLALGVALLEVLIQTIVLIVGFASKPDDVMIRMGVIEWDPHRHRNDFFNILKAVLLSALFFLALRYGIRLRTFLMTRLQDSRFATFVGKRYLIAREGGALANLISSVSILGVTVGVMALVVVISVMNGFDKTLMSKMMGVFSHVEVWPGMAGREDFSQTDYERALYAIERVPGVIGAAPLVQKQTFFQATAGIGAEKQGGILRGLDVERERTVTQITNNILDGGVGTPRDREVVLGSELARKLMVQPGDEIYAFGGKLVSTGRGPAGKISRLRVVGLFKTGLHDIDSSFAYTTVETVQNLYLMGDSISAIHIKVEDPFQAGYNRQLIFNELPQRESAASGYLIRTWQDINPEFFAALKTEKIAMFIILTLIIVVAALNIIGTLVMVVTQKTREIGILKSMGATPGMILRIFLFHGFFIGLVGTALGICCGLWICRFVDRDIEKIFVLPAGVYGLDKLPVITDPATIIFIALISLIICTLAGVVPSLVAAQKDPIESLRHT